MLRRQFLAGLCFALGSVSCRSQLSAQPNGADRSKTRSRSSAARGRRLDEQALEDTLVGSSYMGCGGGGGLEAARELIAADLAAGLVFRRLSVDQLGDDEFVASPYTLESLAPMTAEMQARLDEVGSPPEAPTIASFRLLEKNLDREFVAVIVGEIGPLSMAEALSLGAHLGVPSLDADTVGRATPEINQHSVRVAGHSITPAAAVTLFGDEVVLQGVRHPSREEDVFRALSVVSRQVGVTDAAIPGSIAKSEHVLVTGSVGLAESIGRAVREAISAGGDAVAAALLAGDGYRLFEGTVASFDWEDLDGFLVGTVTLAGVAPYAGQILELTYKNEHLVARRNGAVIATCPDLITLVDRQSSLGIGNPEFREGQRVAALGFRAPALWRRPAGLAVFEPRYFGYDIDYVPIERRLGEG